jgi:DNA-binding MarR family transcriptional regulator
MQKERAEVGAATEVVMLGSRVLVGIAARTVPESADVTLPQLRALVLLASAGELKVTALARRLGVDPSTATRLCDRLVARDLIERDTAEESRREVRLRLAPAGTALVEAVTAERRAAIAEILERVPAHHRRQLVDGLSAFVAASGEEPHHAWSFGWAASG